MRTALTWERLLHGELPSDAGDGAVLERLRAEDAAFLAAHPLAPSRPRRAPTRRLGFGLGLGSLAALLAVAVGSMAWPSVHDAVKGGGSTLVVFEGGGERARLLAQGAQVAAGDEVQFAYSLGQTLYVAVVSVDGRGTVTQHLPLASDQGQATPPHALQVLPYSYRLDDAPGFEDVFLITSPRPFALSELRPALVRYAQAPTTSLVLPTPLTAVRFHLAKKVAP